MNNVLSNMERTNIFPNCGFLYGGNSNTIDDQLFCRQALDIINEYPLTF